MKSPNGNILLLQSHFQLIVGTFLKPAEKMSTSKEEETTATQNATGVTPEMLKDKLEKELESTHVEIQDLSGSSPKQFLITVKAYTNS